MDKDENDFQKFSLNEKLSKVFISEQLLNELQSREQQSCRLVNKYLPIDYFIDSIIKHYFYMSAPSKWEDPFETKYLEILDGPIMEKLQQKDKDKLKDMSIYCTCMTYNDSENEEASWKSYGNDKEQIIRVSYDFDKLCEIIDKATDGVIYIGKMNYKPRKAIVTLKGVNEEAEGASDSLEVLYVNNFCLKQEAYKHEKELRFCRIKTGEKYKKVEEYKIENVDLSPAIMQVTLPPINHNRLSSYVSMAKNIDQIKKYLIIKAFCPNVSIHMSNLYDSDKIEMTTELKL